MNLDLNVFSSSSATRYIGGDQVTWDSDTTTFDSLTTFDGGLIDEESYETDGVFDTNTFSSTSTTRYSVEEFDSTLDMTLDATL